MDPSQPEFEKEHNSLQIHFFYTVVILVGIILILATRNWTSLPGFTEYLSVAATITSLVLGVLAIIYSFVSSNSMNGSLGSIQASAQDISNIGTSLRTVVAGGQTLQDRAEKRNEELHLLIGELRATIETVSNKTSEIAGRLDTFPSQFGELRDEVRKRAPVERVLNGSEELRTMWNAEKIKTFLAKSSLLALVAMKALSDAKQNKSYCDLKILFEKSLNFQYVYGTLICAQSAGILKYEFPDDKVLMFGKARLSNPSEELRLAIENEFSRRLTRGAEKYVDQIEKSLIIEV
ncbi:hypothetical protein ACFOY5_04520 [Massilia aurea]|jgi:methyl-accepting chemotaxis protein|uniref:hypothetical protein n=1 Tax=Massilia aurea TaxID=373040 RepID=UPI002163C227|nr:hypothetical protein [Massilia aurea]MCS0707462.1 hypothetical protein [Massilia aurea]